MVTSSGLGDRGVPAVDLVVVTVRVAGGGFSSIAAFLAAALADVRCDHSDVCGFDVCPFVLSPAGVRSNQGTYGSTIY